MLHRDCEKVRGEIRNQIKVSLVNEKKNSHANKWE